MYNTKHSAENAINEFYYECYEENKKFKIFSVCRDKGRVLITLSSAKKNDKFIESGSYSRMYPNKR